MLLILFRNVLCPKQMFPSLRAQGNVMSNNVSTTMFPRLPPPLGSKVECSSRMKPGYESRPSPYLYCHPLVLLHLLEPRIDIIHVTPELIPVGHDTNSLLLLVDLVTGLQPATRQIKQRLVDMITPCPLPVSKKFAFFQQMLHEWLEVVDLTLCNLQQIKTVGPQSVQRRKFESG